MTLHSQPINNTATLPRWHKITMTTQNHYNNTKSLQQHKITTTTQNHYNNTKSLQQLKITTTIPLCSSVRPEFISASSQKASSLTHDGKINYAGRASLRGQRRGSRRIDDEQVVTAHRIRRHDPDRSVPWPYFKSTCNSPFFLSFNQTIVHSSVQIIH